MIAVADKKVLDTDPKQLASLIGDIEVGGRIWKPGELAEILRHQMTTPLHIDLARNQDTAGELKRIAGERGLLLKSFGDLLQHKEPPIALLKLMKEFAKACRLSPDSTLPREISSVIYFASIIAAMTRCSRRITTLSNSALRDAVTWALKQPWLDDTLRAVFLEGEQFLADATKSGTGKSRIKKDYSSSEARG